MGEATKIEWTDHSWSPWVGCQKVGPGCDHCYAEALNKRAGHSNWGPGAQRRRTSRSYWRQPYRWNTHNPGSVFPSLCDPFDNEVPSEWRADFGWLIRETPNLTWLLLTKRIGNAATMLEEMFAGGIGDDARSRVCIGATFVNQREVDRDWDKLIQVGADFGLRTFGSFEPLLGPVELPPFGSPYIDWVIVGGESGHGARPMHPDWVRNLRDQCEGARVPFLFKQWGEWLPWQPEQPPSWRSQAGGWLDGNTLPDFNDSSVKGWTDACLYDGSDICVHQRVGKKASGRLLDGEEHNGALLAQDR